MKSSKIAALVLFSALLAISGCQTLQPDVEIPPGAQLSGSTEAHFQKYLAEFRPGVFAVAEDQSSSFYIYCNGTMCDFHGMGMDAIARCNKRAKAPCRLYAKRRNIVWSGPPLN